ncbi:MAG: hypothetical protein IT289_12320 [Oligoflexia bacterium]|nr:hypothetical protein [Oligoflexia bacterium]
MTILKRSVLGLILAVGFATQVRAAGPSYEMFGGVTTLWEQDIDYFSRPILLTRTNKTAIYHRLQFNVNRYETYCAQWENRCVAYNQQGQCVSYQRVCAYWDKRVYKVEKTINLDFRKAAVLSAGDKEVYELQVQRIQPGGDGEDFVRTWIVDKTVLKPVNIRRIGDYDYYIELK